MIRLNLKAFFSIYDINAINCLKFHGFTASYDQEVQETWFMMWGKCHEEDSIS